MQKIVFTHIVIALLIFISCQDEKPEPEPEVYVSNWFPEFYDNDIITSIFPEDGEINVDNLSDIEIEFDKGIYKDCITDTIFEENSFFEDEIYKLNNVSQAIRHQYRIVLDSIYVANTNGTLYPGKIQWNKKGTGCTYSLFDVFSGEQTIKINIISHIEELINDSWTQLVYLDGKEAKYNNTYSFSCIEEADTIISTNILASYPEDNMLNLYKGEYPEGGIKLYKAQTKCFELGPNETSFVRFTSIDTVLNVDYTVENLSGGGQQVRFPLPEALEHEKIYKLELVRSNSVSKAEKILYSLFFRVSMYNTLKEKIYNSEILYGWHSRTYIHSTSFTNKSAKILNAELFDNFELANIECLAGFTGSNWYEDYILPLIYSQVYQLQELGFVYQSTIDGYNIPPLNAASIKQDSMNIKLNSLDEPIGFPEFAFISNNSIFIFYLDYYSVRQFCYHLLEDPDVVMTEELTEYCENISKKWNYPGYGTTDFSVTLQYYIPAFDYYGTKSRTIWVDNEALNE